jgi:hypothetical protein
MAKQRKEVERKVMGELVKMENIGDSVAGKLLEVHEGNTKFGMANFADIVNEDGEKKAVLLTADLMSSYDWDSLKGKEIEIEYTSTKTTKNGVMKVFNVYELE